jgi:uncharacterized membrane protein YcaP (DUF421 family)
MQTLTRGLVIYLILLVLFRLTGKRTLAETTPFDLVLLLIISETTQQAMVAEDHSLTNALILIIALVGIDVTLAWAKDRIKWLDRVLDGRPLLIVKRGEFLRDRMHMERVAEDEILAAARENHGIVDPNEIEHAVLETDGTISVIPVEPKSKADLANTPSSHRRTP